MLLSRQRSDPRVALLRSNVSTVGSSGGREPHIVFTVERSVNACRVLSVVLLLKLRLLQHNHVWLVSCDDADETFQTTLRAEPVHVPRDDDARMRGRARRLREYGALRHRHRLRLLHSLLRSFHRRLARLRLSFHFQFQSLDKNQTKRIFQSYNFLGTSDATRHGSHA